MSKVVEFSIHYTQILNEASDITQALPLFAKDPENLIKLYRIMVLTRVFDTKAIALQRTGKMGTYASSLGQEAISAAIGSSMQAQDVLCPYYRDYAAMLQRGVKMSEIYAYWGGDERGSAYQHNKEDLPIAVPIASQYLHAAGIATAFKLRNQARVAVTTIGDGGTSKGDFYEALNVAGVWNLPVVFIINNNRWAISVPLTEETSCKTLAQKAIAAGIPGEQVDGNDIIAVKDVLDKAIAKARNQGGPTLIECLTYRLCDHTTADDASRYRPKEELDKAWQVEPIKRLRVYLEKLGVWDDAKEQALQDESTSQVEAAVLEYQHMTAETPAAMFDHMYANLPKTLLEQREQAMAEGEVTHG